MLGDDDPAGSEFRVDILDRFDRSTWNKWVSMSPSGTIFQTAFWADRLTELWKCQPYYVVVRREREELPLVALLGFRVRASQVYESFTSHLLRLTRVQRGSDERFEWYGQAVLLEEAIGLEAYKYLLREIESFCRAQNIPAIAPSELPISFKPSVPTTWETKEWATLLVDLRLNHEELWQNLKKTARKAVRYAQEKGIVVRRITSLEDLHNYYAFACDCAKRYNKRMFGFADFETMWRHFRPNAIFETFVAEKNGDPIAGLSIWGYNGIVAELGSFQSERSFHEKLYGQDLIKWEVLRWGSSQGYRTFDLAGINPNPNTEKERGIRQFKEKWGGEYRPYVVVSWNGRKE